jgi:hypothetical protein
MITTAHPVAPEDLMALLDGELPVDEARVVSAHLDQCAECAELTAQFRTVSRSLSGWTVPEAPSSLEESVMAQAAQGSSATKPGRTVRLSFRNWRLWAIGCGGAVAAVLVLVLVGVSLSYYEDHPGRVAYQVQSQTPSHSEVAEFASSGASQRRVATEQKSEALQGDAPLMNSVAATDPGAVAKSRAMRSQPMQGMSAGIATRRPNDVGGGGTSSATAAAASPMIARTATLTVMVKDISAARTSFDAILARHHAYSAELVVALLEDAPPHGIQASLRIPAPELGAALIEFKSLGRVQKESQSGEEVTQQHTDLAARLQNSRETEQRLRDILAQRTGKIEDVLQVEEEIARVRGEIEGMEADQRALEHRVDFATVDLQLVEEYKEQFSTPSTSVSTRIGNAFVDGMRNAASMMLGLVLFIEEAGPVVLIWLVILGVPTLLVWKRYRRMKAKV